MNSHYALLSSLRSLNSAAAAANSLIIRHGFDRVRIASNSTVLIEATVHYALTAKAIHADRVTAPSDRRVGQSEPIRPFLLNLRESIYSNNNIYLLKSQIYILNTIQTADTNGPLEKS